MIDITLKTKNGGRRVKALVDSGAEANCVKRRLALEMDVPLLNEGATPLASPDGKRIYSYGDCIFKVAAEDSLGDRRECDVRFASCDFDLDDVDVILGYPWLTTVDPLISFREATWRHQIRPKGLEVASAKEFAKELKRGSHIYLLTAVPAPGGRRIAAVSAKGVVHIPEKYRDLSKVFSTDAAGILPDHHTMEHRIDLESGS